MVDEALRAYSFAPLSDPKLTNSTEVQDAIRGLEVRKASGPNGIPNRALKHFFAKGCIRPRQDIQRGSSHAVLPNILQARTRDLHPETWDGPGTAPFILSHKSAGHDWQIV